MELLAKRNALSVNDIVALIVGNKLCFVRDCYPPLWQVVCPNVQRGEAIGKRYLLDDNGVYVCRLECREVDALWLRGAGGKCEQQCCKW